MNQHAPACLPYETVISAFAHLRVAHLHDVRISALMQPLLPRSVSWPLQQMTVIDAGEAAEVCGTGAWLFVHRSTGSL